MTFQYGNRVLVTCHGKTVQASVFTASADGLSVLLLLDAFLGTYQLLMPVIWLEDKYMELVSAHEVVIRPMAL